MTSESVERRLVASPEVITALAVPARLAILNHLMRAGPQTASECAEVVGQSPSNCSWHLRELARIGLVERDDGAVADRRTKPWRASVTGLRFAPADGPADAMAQSAVKTISADEANAAFADYLEHEHELPRQWSDAASAHDYAVLIDPSELAEIGERIDAIVRPYLRPTRTDAPSGSAVVRVTLRAFVDRHLRSTDA